MPEPLDDAPPDALVVLLLLLDAAGALLELLVLLLLLLPHAASPRATAMTRAARTVRLILPDTTHLLSSRTECATITRSADPLPLA
jgi:hypothetical protein